MDLSVQLAREFAAAFGQEQAPRLYRAPGRVNLIGEHTDYNDGFVMPAAINRDCQVAAAVRSDRRLHIRSANLAKDFEIELDAHVQPAGNWTDYPHGVAVMLLREGIALPGANLLIHGDVPLGAGLSSSAALEVACALALLDLAGAGTRMDRMQLALLCQRAENEFVGARCGIMDQFIACHGRAGHALLLDCRSLQYRALPLPADVHLVVCNTMVKHAIAGGEYNQRRAQCEEGVRLLAQAIPGKQIRALRDVTLAELERERTRLPELVYRRCRHVVTENERTQAAAKALEAGDLAEFGRLMAASHASLRDDYEVSCPELDLMVGLAKREPGVLGARMTGGGFGGCTINLVQARHSEQVQQSLARKYEAQSGRRPEIYACRAAAGAARLDSGNGEGATQAAHKDVHG